MNSKQPADFNRDLEEMMREGCEMNMKFSIPTLSKVLFIIFALCTSQLVFANNIQTQSIALNGKNFTIDEVVKIARPNALVKLTLRH